ncbi:hypothetical protein FHT40_004827 [Mycolicibacterium sp. BK556]|uniref:hypothetical protein n=1 Tax=Mycobacteriaceae TaxID=1762 RepID=UPI0010616A73|nr:MULTISPECIES: hypothetical protein [Mycobacteriaceae]MBB3605143.1 hypothetical protein [Mycolicibacterium sp. BK556]MBB3635339.1 hypothetical protein [Mycolicibacterium sp. BK607]MBB3747867.1 hypothetical protein [Mycolicibacterium sp. BK634]TDO07999.1 hypothetical protein EV580_5568 [Mycobacterium sp. BK086]
MADKASLPSTEPHHAPIFDTGPHPEALRSLTDEPEAEISGPSIAFSELEAFDTDSFLRPLNGHAEPVVVPPAVIAASDNYQSVKRWQFVFIVAAVWVLAAAAGLGFYFWWYTSLNKTPAVFFVLIYLIFCSVGSMLVSMVQNRPSVTALAIALMSAPLASVATAALLHGAYYFEWIARPTIG